MNDDTNEFEPTIINAEPVRDHLIAELTRQVKGLRRDIRLRPLMALLVAALTLAIIALSFFAYYTYVTVPHSNRLDRRIERLENQRPATTLPMTTSTTVIRRSSPDLERTQPAGSSQNAGTTSPGTTAATRSPQPTTTTTRPDSTTSMISTNTTRPTSSLPCLPVIHIC